MRLRGLLRLQPADNLGERPYSTLFDFAVSQRQNFQQRKRFLRLLVRRDVLDIGALRASRQTTGGSFFRSRGRPAPP